MAIQRETARTELRRPAAKQEAARTENKRPAVKKYKKRSTAFWDFLKIACFSVFLIYAVNVIITNQAHMAEQRAEIAKLKEEKAIAQQISDEYNRLLNSRSEHEYMREAAFEHGYAFPWEKRFFPINNPE